MFGVGLMEIAVILVVAIIAFGPDRLPELARQAGQMLRTVRRMADTARDDLRSELGPEYADLELRDLDPRAIVKKHIQEAMAEDDDPDRPETTETRGRPGTRPLPEGAVPPYDSDAT